MTTWTQNSQQLTAYTLYMYVRFNIQYSFLINNLNPFDSFFFGCFFQLRFDVRLRSDFNCSV